MADQEKVDIKVSVQDDASAKMEQINKRIDATADHLDKVSERTKKSSDLMGQFAGVMGGGAFADGAGMIAGLADSVGDYVAQAKDGGAHTLTFKAGVAGLAGVLAFGLGKAIGDIAFGTKHWARELENADKRLEGLQARVAAGLGRKLSNELADVGAIKDDNTKTAAVDKASKVAENNIQGVLQGIANTRKELDALNNQFHWSKNEEALAAHLQKQLEGDEATLEAYREQKRALEDLTSQRTKDNKARDEAYAKADASDSFLKGLRDELELLRATKDEQAKILAMRNTVGPEAQAEAERLLKEKAAIEAKKEADKQAAEERKKNLAETAKATADYQKLLADSEREAAKESERLATMRQSEIDSLRKMGIELMDGKQAAAAFALELKGISGPDAAKMAEAGDMLRQAGELKDQQKKSVNTPELQATQGRILSGVGKRGEESLAADMRKAVEIQEEMKRLLEDAARLLGDLNRKPPVKVQERSA